MQRGRGRVCDGGMTMSVRIRPSLSLLISATVAAFVVAVSSAVETTDGSNRPTAGAPNYRATTTSAAADGLRLEPLFTQVAGERTPARPPSDIAKHIVRRTTLSISDKTLAAGGILTAEAHVLNLFPDVLIVAMRDHVESRSQRDYSWFGSIPGDPFGHVILAVVSGKLTATIRYQHRSFLVHPVLAELYEALEIDERGFPEDEPSDLSVGEPGPVSPTGTRPPTRAVAAPALDVGGLIRLVPWEFARREGDVGPFELRPDDGSVIDVMVVYTHYAAWLSDPWLTYTHQFWPNHPSPIALLGKIQAAFDEANLSFQDSGPTRLNMIGPPMELTMGLNAYQETGVMWDDLRAVRLGEIADVHVQREIRAADLVVLVTGAAIGADGKAICGTSAWVRPAGAFADEISAATFGYLGIKQSCLLSNTTLAHEVGHQLGAAHDWYTFIENGSTVDVPLFAHGYVRAIPTNGVRTIMSYDLKCVDEGVACPKVNRFSDPDVSDAYGPLGIAATLDASEPSDVVRAITSNLVRIANYRRSACRATNGC
jgi:hypothetical protein